MRYFYIAWDMWDTRTITYDISITWGVNEFYYIYMRYL